MENKLIASFKKTFKLFKQPDRISDIIEYNDIEYLIIGIEKVKLDRKMLVVTYTCQNLTMFHNVQPSINASDNTTEFDTDLDIHDEYKQDDWIFTQRDNLIRIGQVFEYKDNYYRWLTYTDLVFNFTTLQISALAEPIKPMTVESTRKHLLNHKRNKIGLSLV